MHDKISGNSCRAKSALIWLGSQVQNFAAIPNTMVSMWK